MDKLVTTWALLDTNWSILGQYLGRDNFAITWPILGHYLDDTWVKLWQYFNTNWVIPWQYLSTTGSQGSKGIPTGSKRGKGLHVKVPLAITPNHPKGGPDKTSKPVRLKEMSHIWSWQNVFLTKRLRQSWQNVFLTKHLSRSLQNVCRPPNNRKKYNWICTEA